MYKKLKGSVLRNGKFQCSSFYTLSLLTPIKSAIMPNAHIHTYLHESNFKEPGTRGPPADIHLV